LFERVVEERHALGEHLAEMARGVGGRKPEPGIGFARFDHDLHRLLAREVHHGVVLRQAVHEERPHAPIAGAQVRAREQRTADAAAAVPRQHRDPELGVPAAAGDVRRTDEVQSVVIDAEGRIALEIDARDVRAHRIVVYRYPEA